MGGSGSKTVLNELHGLQERLIDGLAAPELADRDAENKRLRALLSDTVRVIGQLRGVDGDDAAAGDGAKERHVGYILITPDTVVETHLHAGDGASGPLDGVAHADAIDGLVNLSLVDHPPPNVDLII